MSAEAITIISGVRLLAEFAPAGWNLRRNRLRGEQIDDKRPSHDSS